MGTCLVVGLGGDGTTGLETAGEVQDVGDVLNTSVDAEGHEAGSQAGTVAEETNALALESLVVDHADQAGKATPDATAVHVTAQGSDLDSGVDALLEALLGETHEGLLDGLVGQGLLVVHVAQLGGDVGKGRGVGVGEVVVVQETGVRLLDELAGGGVEGKVIEAVQAGLGRVAVGGAVGGLLGLALAVGAVGGVEGLGVAGEGVVAVDVGVLAGQVGLVEVVGVLHVAASQTGLHDDGGVGADEEGDGAGTTGGTGVALGVEGNVTGDDDAVAAVPGGALDPVDGVEDGVGAAVAGVDGVDTLNVGVVTKELHQDGLDRLGLVQHGLGTDLEAANGVGVDLVLLEEVGGGGEGEGVDVWGGSMSAVLVLCMVFALEAMRARRVVGALFSTGIERKWRSRREERDIPSRSSQKLILVWPRPMVYLPVLTPSNFSSSVCSTY